MLAWGVEIPESAAIVGSNERCIELPLAIEFLALDQPGQVLDAGCSVRQWIWRHMGQAQVTFVTFDISTEHMNADPRISGISWDLRRLTEKFAPKTFRAAVCVSTLEHVGMENRNYGGTSESAPETKWQAVDALKSVAERLFVTVPWEREPQPKETGRWLPWSLEDVARCGGEARYYARTKTGWWGGGVEPVMGTCGPVPQIVCLRWP